MWPVEGRIELHDHLLLANIESDRPNLLPSGVPMIHWLSDHGFSDMTYVLTVSHADVDTGP